MRSLLLIILTQQTYPQEISDGIINCMNDGKIKFAHIRKERFILSNGIHNVKLPSLTDTTKDHDNPEKAATEEASVVKENAVT